MYFTSTQPLALTEKTTLSDSVKKISQAIERRGGKSAGRRRDKPNKGKLLEQQWHCAQVVAALNEYPVWCGNTSTGETKAAGPGVCHTTPRPLCGP